MMNIKHRLSNIVCIPSRLVLCGLLVFLLVSCGHGFTNKIPATVISTETSHSSPSPTPTEIRLLSPTPDVTKSSPTSPAPTQTESGPTSPAPTQTKSTPTLGTPTSAITPVATQSTSESKIKTVFIIMMENHNWSDIFKSPSAPYINQTLLPQASFAEQYYNPPGNHPSEPNYLWLEAGTAFGIHQDGTPSSDHQSTTDHLVTYLDKAGISWKAYQEGISGKDCPLKGTGLYAPKHNPMVFFDDVTNKNDPASANCIAHERPYTELQADLKNNTAAQYNFITPNLCHDMHNSDGCDTSDSIKNGDTWLSEQVPMLLESTAYRDGGVIFITWDESEDGDHPIGMLVLSPLAKGGSYSNSIHYTHSSTLRTIQEIFNITPLLGDASKATDLIDLFRNFP